ncbi:MAG: hypothetical protein RLO52_33835 [Sandaracinaceae bacterium]
MPDLAAMRDLAATLQSASTPEARFRAIERLALEWHGRPPRGYPRSEVSASAESLGVTLPPTVRRWYESLALTEGVAFGQNHVVAPDRWVLDGRRLTFAVENQDNWRLLVGLEGDDPAVVSVGSRPGSLSLAFSLHALQTALFESVMGAAQGICNGEAAPGAEAWLLELFGDPVAEPWGDAGPGAVSFYAGAPGLAFHQSAGDIEWIYFALVDDHAVRAKVSGEAPIRHWALTPDEGA